MNELIIRSKQCSAGDQFSSQKVRKRLNDFGGVICASEMLVINAAPGGMFSELLIPQPRAFPWAAADAVRAMNVVIAFARSQSPEPPAQFRPVCGRRDDRLRCRVGGAHQ